MGCGKSMLALEEPLGSHSKQVSLEVPPRYLASNSALCTFWGNKASLASRTDRPALNGSAQLGFYI